MMPPDIADDIDWHAPPGREREPMSRAARIWGVSLALVTIIWALGLLGFAVWFFS
jgi:hypothetical protein